MPAERLDAMCAREKDGKTYWSRLGVAFPAKQGPGYTLYLDSIPASVDGQYKIMLMKPKPRDGGGAPAAGGNDDSDIPF